MSSTIDSPPVGAPYGPRARRFFGGTTPTGAQSLMGLRVRRLTMAALMAATVAVLSTGVWTVAASDGWSIPEMAMFLCFLISLPWVAIGFWNGVIGFLLLRFARDPAAVVAPCVARAGADDAIASRTAIVMCIRHEDVGRVLRRLDATVRSLDATGHAGAFDVFVLSDSTRPDIVAHEEPAIAAWGARLVGPGRVVYRRRDVNAGFKAGNVRDFLVRWGDDYDFAVMLDADSVMSGAAILRLVRVMQANPRLGILQTLVLGLPARTPFARAFQFGMRATMRPYTMGAAWWAADCGPYWGHNAAIRTTAFREHAELPVVPGRGPLSGPVLSHDQIEAVLMRRAGYEVCVLPEEGGSWEDTPPSLPEFLRRNLRWCQGNLQYVRLIGMPGLGLTSRVQLLLAIMMYVGAPAWIGFMVAGAAEAWGPPPLLGVPDAPEPFPAALGLGLFGAMLFLTFAPKVMGYLDVVLRAGEARRYGGPQTFGAGIGVEVLFGFLLAPLVSFSITAFMAVLLLFGRTVGWDAQDRDGARVGWGEAIRKLWPATLFGVALSAALGASEPQLIVWTAPVLASFLLAIPFAVLTSMERVGRFAARFRLGAQPEELHASPEVMAVADLPPPPLRAYAAPAAPFFMDGGVDLRRLRAAEDAG